MCAPLTQNLLVKQIYDYNYKTNFSSLAGAFALK